MIKIVRLPLSLCFSSLPRLHGIDFESQIAHHIVYFWGNSLLKTITVDSEKLILGYNTIYNTSNEKI